MLEGARDQVSTLYDTIVAVVANTSYTSYGAFRTDLEPYLQQAREITGQRGSALFVPPSLLHMVARNQWNTDDAGAPGLIGLDYVAHGVHFSVVPGFRVEGF